MTSTAPASERSERAVKESLEAARCAAEGVAWFERHERLSSYCKTSGLAWIPNAKRLLTHETAKPSRTTVLFINAEREQRSREVVGAKRRLHAILEESPGPKERSALLTILPSDRAPRGSAAQKVGTSSEHILQTTTN